MRTVNRREHRNHAASFGEEFSGLKDEFDSEESAFEDAVDDQEYVQRFRASLGVERDLLM